MDNPAQGYILHRMNMTQENDSDIVIVGGGLNGCALAISLAQVGLRVTVVDALPVAARTATGFDGRSYALALASKRLLTAIGIWPLIGQHAQPILEVVASDGRAGEGASPWLLHLDHAEIEEGPMGFMMEDRYLRAALLEVMAATGRVRHLDGQTVVGQSVAPKGASVTLSTGETLTARLIVGCDGRKSGTALRAGIKRNITDYRQDALVCAVAHEQPHNGIAHQFFMPSGPLAILPLSGDRSSIVWSEDRVTARGIAALDDTAFLEALMPRFGDFLGQVSLCGVRYSYPLNLTMAQHIVAQRLVLVGDAAQGVHPIAGQGLNQGLRDVATLVEVLAQARRRGEDIGGLDVLDRHRQWRSFDRSMLAFATDGFNRLFSNNNPLLRFGRDLGMAAATAMPGLRRGILREAAGLNGDLPRLLQGLQV
ncbi:MAG: 2-octaprenyl-6-methoxyphenol hydroxylase [Paracoccaceae bacterium]|jgi:2-octaprenyl-6-methoxyphenol hydroxylase